MNYPDSDKVPDFAPFNCNFDGVLSQVVEIGTRIPSEDDEEDMVLQFVSKNINSAIPNNNN